jgi:hypothetical protein
MIYKIWIMYRIFGLMPEVPEGHQFRSTVPDLPDHTELWKSVCPYHITRLNDVSVDYD